MATFRWRLADFLNKRDISVYALAKTRGVTKMNSIYRLARKGQEPQRIDLAVLAEVITELRQLTGEEVQLADLLEYVPDGE